MPGQTGTIPAVPPCPNFCLPIFVKLKKKADEQEVQLPRVYLAQKSPKKMELACVSLKIMSQILRWWKQPGSTKVNRDVASVHNPSQCLSSLASPDSLRITAGILQSDHLRHKEEELAKLFRIQRMRSYSPWISVVDLTKEGHDLATHSLSQCPAGSGLCLNSALPSR